MKKRGKKGVKEREAGAERDTKEEEKKEEARGRVQRELGRGKEKNCRKGERSRRGSKIKKRER